MRDTGMIQGLSDRLDAVLRRGARIRSRRGLWVSIIAFCWLLIGAMAYDAHRTAVSAEMCALIGAVGVAIFGGGIGFYLGASRGRTDYAADVLDIYRDALEVRDQALGLRNELLRDHGEIRSMRREQEAILARLKSIDPTKFDP